MNTFLCHHVSRQTFEKYILNNLCKGTPQVGNKGQDWLVQKLRKCFNYAPVL